MEDVTQRILHAAEYYKVSSIEIQIDCEKQASPVGRRDRRMESYDAYL